MDVIASRDELAAGLKDAVRGVARASALPVLYNLRVQAQEEPSRLIIRSTDLEIGVTVEVPAQVQAAGKTTLDARMLSDLVKDAPGNGVTLRAGKKGLPDMAFSSGSFEATLKGIEPSEFPAVPRAEDFEAEEHVTLTEATLKTMIDRVAFCAAKDQTRSVLTGVLVEFEMGQLSMVAADGFRLALASVPVEVGGDVSLEAIVPASALSELAAMLDADTPSGRGDVDVYYAESQMLFAKDGREVITQLIEGNFPDYTAIIPDTHNTEVEVGRRPLRQSLSRAMIFAREAANIVRFDVRGNGDGPEDLVMRAMAAEFGDGEEELAITGEGPRLEIAFNGRYVSKVFQALPGDRLKMQFTKSTSPGVFVPAEPADGDIVYVVMPMHIGNA